MPDDVPQDFTYRPAKRGNAATLTMFSGPSGTGKTYSALRFARGLAGPEGKICFADSEHGRALFYADEFGFDHLELNEPFRPEKFEGAAVHAQKQGAVVWVCDSFSHEHTGPGGVLDFFEDEMQRLMDNARKQERNRNATEWELRNSLNFTGWIRPKAQHKHMLQRLWQLNCHIVLCCTAEKKIELIKKNNRTEPVDRGYQPVCGNDIPYAMTMSFLFGSIEKPGVPTVLKPLMPALRPLIDLNQPIDEAFGARIAMWARGEKPEAVKQSPPPADEQPRRNAPRNTAPRQQREDQAPSPPPDDPPPNDDERSTGSSAKPREQDDTKIQAKIAELADKFAAAGSMSEHLALVDHAETRKTIEWLKRNRKEDFERKLNPMILASYERNSAPPPTDPASDPAQQQQQQGGLDLP